MIDLSNRVDDYYKSYDMKMARKDGTLKTRHIDSPNYELKKIQTTINKLILKSIIETLPNYVNGARQHKGIATAASLHTGKEAVLSIDIKNCYPSISSKQVFYAYKMYAGCSDKTAQILTKLTTKSGYLPQGCPTSASLCNLVLYPMLNDLEKLFKENYLSFSQYMDDIFCSGKHEDIIKVVKPALEIIRKRGFEPNIEKLSIKPNSESMKVMGITVNHKLGVGRKRIRRIEREIMKISLNDIAEWEQLPQKRKQDKHSKTCKIEKINGEIHSIKSINLQQADHLRKRLNQKING